MNKLHIVFFIISSFPTIFIAQNCDYKFQYDALIERNTEGYVTNFNNRVSPRAVVTIPVVVHVVWRTPTENISDAQIQSQIDVLNEDFRKKNIDAKDVPGSFRNVAADCEMEFCLAKRDTLGKPTNGIVRVQTTFDNIYSAFSNNRRRIYYADLGGSRNWQPDRYLNIWVCNMGITLGFSTSPITVAVSKPSEDGVIVDYRAFGTIGTALNNTKHNKGRTTTHEIGHYFNLLHIWGESSGCNDDDLVDDTPKQDSAYLGCPSFPQLSCGVGNMYMNFMDYTDDNCMGLFTNGQKARMWAALTQYRSGLMNNRTACETTSVQNIDNQILIYPNPATSVVHIDWKNRINTERSIELRDYLGCIFYQKKVDNTEGVSFIPVSTLPSGIYFVHLNFEQTTIVKKMIITH